MVGDLAVLVGGVQLPVAWRLISPPVRSGALATSQLVPNENIGRVLSANRISAIPGHFRPVFGPAGIPDLER